MTRCTGKCPYNTSIDFPSTIALPLPQIPPIHLETIERALGSQTRMIC